MDDGYETYEYGVVSSKLYIIWMLLFDLKQKERVNRIIQEYEVSPLRPNFLEIFPRLFLLQLIFPNAPSFSEIMLIIYLDNTLCNAVRDSYIIRISPKGKV